MEDKNVDLPWDVPHQPVHRPFQEHDECLLGRAKELARAEMLARMVSVSVNTDEEFGPN